MHFFLIITSIVLPKTSVSAIIQHGKRGGGSLANILYHVHDPTDVDAPTLVREISLEFGSEVANRFGSKLFQEFVNTSRENKRVGVDVCYIVLVYRAAILAAAAFHNARRAFLKLLDDFILDHDGNGQWLLSDIMRVVSVAAVTEEEVECTAGLLQQEIINEIKIASAPVGMDILQKALDSSPSVMQNFRSQLLSKLSSNQRLKLLAGEEVSFTNLCMNAFA